MGENFHLVTQKRTPRGRVTNNNKRKTPATSSAAGKQQKYQQRRAALIPCRHTILALATPMAKELQALATPTVEVTDITRGREHRGANQARFSADILSSAVSARAEQLHTHTISAVSARARGFQCRHRLLRYSVTAATFKCKCRLSCAKSYDAHIHGVVEQAQQVD